MEKNNVLFLSGILLSLILVSGCSHHCDGDTDQSNQETAVLLEIAEPPPASLDSLFPPIADAPIYLFEMFKLSTPFSGILIDLLEGDPKSAMSHFERFKAAYIKTSHMVS